ncbi:AMP-binding protein [Candidatus Obscuribacterales bacterium]|nr:AMP-binding protein [Candidatus Obscuribacterales bacterium]
MLGLKNDINNELPPLPESWFSLPHAFLHQVRQTPDASAVVDSLGTRLTYRGLLLAAVALANELEKRALSDAPIGILLPPSAAAAVANIAVALLGKVSANLNYTTSQSICNACIKECEIDVVISSEKFLKRITLTVEPERMVNLDNMASDLGLFKRVKAWTEAEVVPEPLLQTIFPGLATQQHLRFDPKWGHLYSDKIHAENSLTVPATVIFTSGSTGAPKGVVLSHENILSNIHAIRWRGHIKNGEVVLGVVPYFHSFGLTMTLWTPLCLGEMVVYHYNPFDARRIADLCEKFKATTLVCTPTMLSAYIRRCSVEKFASLKNCIIGGEKLHEQQRQEFEDALGVPPLEGYGLAETAPVVACNVSNDVRISNGRTVPGRKNGSVGMPIPGTKIKILNLENSETMARNSEGMIMVKGPQVMLGYLGKPEETKRVIKDGWFETGDIGYLDDEGFLTITGRLSQFSKIGGEMVSHLAVEEEIVRITGAAQHEVCVTSTDDRTQGEKLVVVYADLNQMPPHTVVSRMRASAMPRIWIPQENDFIRVEEIPILGNGKRDLASIKQIVQSRMGQAK